LSSERKNYCIGHVDYWIENFVTILVNLDIKFLVYIRASSDIDGADDFSQSVLSETLLMNDVIYH